jgi:integration host factor subunit beta
MSTVTKKDLIDRIAKGTDTKRVVIKPIIQNFLGEIIAELTKGNRLEFRDFGVFEPRDRAPRTAQNPKTLERIHVPAKRTVRFKMGQLMKQKLNIQNTKV